MPRITMRPREVSDLEMIANGAFSPLEGFMCEDDYIAVRGNMHLASGLPWTIPVTLSTSEDFAGELKRVPMSRSLPAKIICSACCI